MTIKITSNMNNLNKLSSPSYSFLLKRRSSFFKPSIEDDKFLNNTLRAFLTSERDQNLSFSNVPITWERISTGYRITDFLTERTEDVLELLKTYYFFQNESCGSTTLYIDSHTIRKYQQFIIDVIKDRNSFCALEEGTGKVLGVAMASTNLMTSEALEDDDVEPTKDMFNVLNFENTLLNEANISEYYNVDKYFCIHILCVRTDCYGNGIGTSLVRACLSKAQKLQYPACIGIFPAGASQTIAQRLGFEALSELPWIKLKASKISHEILYNTMFENSFVTCMGILLPLDENDEKSSEKNIDENTQI